MNKFLRTLNLELRDKPTQSKSSASIESKAGPSQADVEAKKTPASDINEKSVTKSSGGFPRFSELPKELQLQIWRLADSARIIKFVNDGRLKGSHLHFPKFDIRASKAISSTCKDAREVVKAYNLQIRLLDQTTEKKKIKKWSKIVSFNSDYDILYLAITKSESLTSVLQMLNLAMGEINSGRGHDGSFLSGIKHIALPWSIVDGSHALPLTRGFPMLKSLMLFLPMRQDVWPESVKHARDSGMLPALVPDAFEAGDTFNKAKVLKKNFEKHTSNQPIITLRWIYDAEAI